LLKCVSLEELHAIVTRLFYFKYSDITSRRKPTDQSIMAPSRVTQDTFVSVKLASPQYPQETYLSVQLKKGSLVERKRSVSSSASLKQQLHFLKTTGRYEAFKLKWLPAYDEPPQVWPIGNWLL